jgi:glycosyltransferase involved in cell wall biosynthesis
MVKNEAILLKEILPIWKDYPIDEFVFYNDISTDDTVEIIKEGLGTKSAILETPTQRTFHESHNRSTMLEYSRAAGADFVVCIDADELISSSILNNFGKILEANALLDVQYYWFNVVGGNIKKYRQDPSYVHNYRTFILPMSKTGKFDLSQWRYHTPRTPVVNLPKRQTQKFGFIHLQSINERFYALKQLWYKHYEFVNYGYDIAQINGRYDPVVNNLQFEAKDTPESIISGIDFCETIGESFDKIEKAKGYKQYILDNKVDQLITFGETYVSEM